NSIHPNLEMILHTQNTLIVVRDHLKIGRSQKDLKFFIWGEGVSIFAIFISSFQNLELQCKKNCYHCYHPAPNSLKTEVQMAES
ncbi:MAG: hypothetical protein MJA29_01980, partial [Candidatus Omnitrophica bacterium]|nr:hypothetical protein [Candidatus Omnitrophota bacterium]